MKKLLTISMAILLVFFVSSCGDTNKKESSLTGKKAQLKDLKSQKDKLDTRISDLEKEIAKIDTSSTLTQEPKLVALAAVKKVDFKHYLGLQGTVDSKSIFYVTPSGQPGQVTAIYVKQGDKVRKGQLVLKLDDDVQKQNVKAVQEQLGSVQAQLALAKSVYERQKNLWNQQIGTEVQLLQSKTNVETLENQLKAIQAQVNAAQAQANQSNVYSNVSGTIDDITTHVGETFNGNPLTGGYVRIVNDADLKITVTVPENYAGQVKKGTQVIVNIPDANKTFTSEISFLSQAIGATTRGFTAEIKVPKDATVRPNQIAIINILDYSAPDAIAVPVNTVQTGENGKYVLVASKKGDELVAKKIDVTVGNLSGDSIEIKSGLQPGEQLITLGYQGLFDGQAVTTTDK